MSDSIPGSELIINGDGSIYHLNLRPEHIARTIVLVGDPGRVAKVSRHFDQVLHVRQNREFLTHTGRIGQTELSVISTGIGTDNIDIVLNELDALVNIDLDQRKPKDGHTALDLIRLGTSGSLQEDIPVDSFLLSTHGIGFDGLLNFYAAGAQVEDKALTEAFMQQTGWPKEFARPYVVAGDAGLLSKLKDGTLQGMTATANGFYGPQGRQLRLVPTVPDLNERLNAFRHEGHRIANFEMETSALFGLGKALGHHCATVCAIIANRFRKEYSKDHDLAVEKLIVHLLDKLK
jgi:uridine phosphorylase